MNISKDKLKILGAGVVVLAAGSIMLQPLLTYVAGLARVIGTIISMVLITYLIVTVVCRMKGKDCSSSSSCDSKGSADAGTEQGDVEV